MIYCTFSRYIDRRVRILYEIGTVRTACCCGMSTTETILLSVEDLRCCLTSSFGQLTNKVLYFVLEMPQARRLRVQ